MSPYLMTSASPARNSRHGEGFERFGVSEDGSGLMKGANQILAAGMVDAGLAADRRVDLREQRGGHLHERHAALVAGRGKSGHVANNAAAERNDCAVAAEAVRHQHIDDARDGSQRLVRLAIRQDGFDDATATEGLGQRVHIKGRDGGIADNQHVAAGKVGANEIRLTQQALADQNRVAALA